MAAEAGAAPLGRLFRQPGGPQNRPAVLRLLGRALERLVELMWDEPRLGLDTRHLVLTWCRHGVELIELITFEDQFAYNPYDDLRSDSSDSSSSSELADNPAGDEIV